MIRMISKHPIHLEIYAESGSRGNATGFLYQDRDDRRWLITARHNLYPSPDDIDSFPPTKEYHETLISTLALKLRGYPTKWALTQHDLLHYGRISKHQPLDIAAIQLTELLEKNSIIRYIISTYHFFTIENFPREENQNIGNSVIISGFSF
jgi:hypothetical protein